MKLYYSSTSPFVRKVLVLAYELGLADQIEKVTTNPWVAEDTLLAENPLCKIPTLVTDDGMSLYDSSVICEYLISLKPLPNILPAEGAMRWNALRLEALADGLLDASVLRLLESKRAEELRSTDWDTMQKSAVQRALGYLETCVGDWGKEINIGLIAVAVALGYLDFRFANEDWRVVYPELAAWYTGFATRDAMRVTVPCE